MRVVLAKSAGFCFGVSRAVGLTENAAGPGVWALGHVIHNADVVNSLCAKGMKMAEKEEEIPSGATAVIRAHGERPEVLERLRARGVTIVDTTCPCVSRIHGIAEREFGLGRRVLVVGTRNHPEARAISARAGNAPVIESPEEMDMLAGKGFFEGVLGVSMVAQTTADRTIWKKCVNSLKKLCTNPQIFDTICSATQTRQSEAAELAERADVMIVIGDRMSTNSVRLRDICAERCRTYFVSGWDELRPFLPEIAGMKPELIGITAGASTPAGIIEEVNNNMTNETEIIGGGEVLEPTLEAEERLEAAVDAEVESAESEAETFAEMVDKSMKTLHTGQRVKGIVTRVTGAEIQMDLGTKHAGFIPVSELSDDPGVKPDDIAKVGDELEVFVTKVNDAEGYAMLSKKRVDAAKGWDSIDSAKEDRAILEGTVVEINKGGVVASVNGVRVFIPASHTGVAKDKPLDHLLKTKVMLRITEINRAKRRVIGSIRYASEDMRKAAQQKIWESVEVGNVYEGTVKSLTSFGAFIDIGGADGMAHITELSWNRLKHPSEAVSVGDTVTARVIALDREKKKISLSLKNENDNPWTKFTESCKVGDIVEAKIVKLVEFGAFAQILPGVDGLIHISQLADRRVVKPADVVAEGDVVSVKIIDINTDKQKISLSIRAAMEEAEPDYDEE
ncbi:MAG: bifunctional 4-hydroxy-3-methylbut-2-enyl diphosphate reductase/30S ribosomal protein S1 [Clostridiales bacterium]|nr:bifunctional 4-hydroxy-3-methylbut-2-enyl diphosphate reductase/30S ribosomal protein S1 [Clostridiales bacterium]